MTSETANSVSSNGYMSEDSASMERRIFRGMCLTVMLVAGLSAVVAPWRVTTGLILGGVLSILNHHWLRTSIAAAFASPSVETKPNLGVWRFILRYFVVAAIITIAYLFDVVSLTATLVGLCSFAVAALAEAFMQIYFIVVYGRSN